MSLLMPAGGATVAVTPAAVSSEGTAVSATDLTTYTFSGVSFGTASSDRKMVIAVAGEASSAVTSVTIGGVSGSLIVAKKSSGGSIAELWQANVPTGTTGTVIVVFGATNYRCGIGAYRITSAAATADDTGGDIVNQDPMSDTLNCPALGVIVGVVGAISASAIGWTGITEDYEATIEASYDHSGASNAFATQQINLSIQVAGAPNGAFAIASFGSA